MKTSNMGSCKQNFFFSSNRLAAFILATVLFASLSSVRAANPASGTVNPTVGSSVTWNGTAPGGASPDGETTCVEGTNCETFTLTVSGTPADWTGKLIKVNIGWALPATDYDLYIHKDSATGPEVDRSAEGAPVINETAQIDPSVNGTGIYAVRVVYFSVVGAADQYRGTATVENKTIGPEPTPPLVSNATAPTYNNFAPPATLGQRAGEPTIGLNFSTGKAMFIASLQTLRVTFNDLVSPATATWENKSAPNTSVTSFDPILFTDSQTNRTFVSQLLPSKVSLMSFTDNDGESWTPSQGSGINSGVDHQTVGGGPYARNADGSLKGAVVRNPAITYPNAVYYASQDIGVAEIARSDDGGLTFGVAVPMYDITQCGGLHGHIKVAPDGTVYVPNKGCGGQQAAVVSEDNGLTWQIRKVPGSTGGRTDPSIGIGADGTIYFGYANGDGKARIAVSRDKGVTWENDQDAGFYLGINNTVFPAVTAGDGDRAAFFFLGTTTPGSAGTGTDQTSPYFNGVWYGYIATTYDRGRTWVTVNATPNDPVQRGVVCTNGTTCPTGTRNLLDFNDMEVDKQGRAVAGLADGCTSAECIQGVDKNNDGQLNTRFDNDGARRALIIRQASGLGLFSAFDPPAPPTVIDIEDDDNRVAYSNGWHKISDPNASAGHYRLNNGKSPNQFAKLTFNVTGQGGSIEYYFAKTSKGGTADVYLDGGSRQVASYNGTGFGSIKFEGLSAGQHTLEIRNLNGAAYVDKFRLTSGTSNASPSAGPGATSSSNDSINLGGDITKSLTVQPGTSEIAVMTETVGNTPIRLVLIDPSGSIVNTVEATNGVAVIEMPATQTGTYLVKVVNLSVGPVQVFSAITPYVAR
jgi:hypothetical protein